MRKDELENLVMTCFVEGKRARDGNGTLPHVPEQEGK